MDIKDLRIGDVVTVKTYSKTSKRITRVASLDECGEVQVNDNDGSVISYSLFDLEFVKVTKELLSLWGAWYDDKKAEYIITFRGGLRIAIRPQVGTDNYIATPIGSYRPKYCKFIYAHTLQHWLWDIYKVDLV